MKNNAVCLWTLQMVFVRRTGGITVQVQADQPVHGILFGGAAMGTHLENAANICAYTYEAEQTKCQRSAHRETHEHVRGIEAYYVRRWGPVADSSACDCPPQSTDRNHPSPAESSSSMPTDTHTHTDSTTFPGGKSARLHERWYISCAGRSLLLVP